MKKIISGLGRQSRMKTKDHKYSITSKHGEASSAKERLFVCLKGNQSHADSDQPTKPVPMAAAAIHRLTLDPMGKCSNAFFSETTNMIKAKLHMNVIGSNVNLCPTVAAILDFRSA
jgi:hypothetical protein